jgi:bacillithiol system protein YtxJ
LDGLIIAPGEFIIQRRPCGRDDEDENHDMSIKQVESEEELESILESELAVLFKHSAICPSSGVALEEIRDFSAHNPEVPVYMLEVRTQRPLSQKVSAYFGITHESPQVILVSRGKAVWHASHYAVTAAGVSSALSDL